MTINAKIIAHSISEAPYNIPIVTVQLRMPRFILAEFNTHRAFSRNASSSRAIPVERLIEDILRETAMPIHWGKNIAGMQANEECNEFVLCTGYKWNDGPGGNVSREEAWLDARDCAITAARNFNDAGYHKQIVNRLLEPFSFVNVLCTATDWDNFFKLRDHKDAQPEIMILAQAIKKAIVESTPNELREGEHHIPYILEEEYSLDIKELIKCSIARCARVSYLTFDQKKPTIENDLKLYEKLASAIPPHLSPMEHIATPDKSWSGHYYQPFGPMDGWMNQQFHGNFVGWIQHRRVLEFDREIDSNLS